MWKIHPGFNAGCRATGQQTYSSFQGPRLVAVRCLDLGVTSHRLQILCDLNSGRGATFAIHLPMESVGIQAHPIVAARANVIHHQAIAQHIGNPLAKGRNFKPLKRGGTLRHMNFGFAFASHPSPRRSGTTGKFDFNKDIKETHRPVIRSGTTHAGQGRVPRAFW